MNEVAAPSEPNDADTAQSSQSGQSADALKSVQSELNALKRRFARVQKENENVTQLYKQAAALRDFNEREKEIQMRYNQMLRDNSPDDIFLLDMELKVLLCTSSVKKAIGREGADEPFLPIVREMFGDTIAEAVESALTRLLPKYRDAASEEGAFELQAETGGELHSFYSINISPAFDSKGEATGIVVLAHDNTEMHEANLRAEAATQAKSTFLANMSHEIRTPMNAILGITEIQLQNDVLPSEVKEALDKIYNSGYMLLGIINDILDLSKIEAGKLELIITQYEVASLINDTVQLNMTRIGSKPIEFILEVDANTPKILIGDELRVKQILNNLLSNAFKYTAEGQVVLSVFPQEAAGEDSDGIRQAADTDQDREQAARTAADQGQAAEAMLVVRVRDIGQGMTQEQVSMLFDEYSRFNQEANRTTEGTGLGMNITQRLIYMMDGLIEVESEPGKGSAFTVRIPQGDTGSGVLGKELAENLQQFRMSSSEHVKRVQINREMMPYGSVLIVDDVETNIYVARGLMAPYGLTIDSADSGFAAIEKIEQGNVYDVVFMDHMMPEMDGMEATKIIREKGYPHPIVALTANAVAGQSDIFLENGFNDFISKPIDIRQLNTVLNRLIRDKQPPEVLEAARRFDGGEHEVAEARAQEHAEHEQAGHEQAGQGMDTPVIDPGFAEIFVRDAMKSLAVLDGIAAKEWLFEEEDSRAYIIHVHGLKSALANIGMAELSAFALTLENAGRQGDASVMKSRTPEFMASLRDLVERLKPKEETGDSAVSEEERQHLQAQLGTLREASEVFDKNTAKAIVAELREKAWPPEEKQLLDSIAEYILHSDFDEIIAAVDGYRFSS
ncbi:MAG: response regulator [Clostridiales bacterium]|nr:response regulator [Clostridiales bacterium]